MLRLIFILPARYIQWGILFSTCPSHCQPFKVFVTDILKMCLKEFNDEQIIFDKFTVFLFHASKTILYVYSFCFFSFEIFIFRMPVYPGHAFSIKKERFMSLGKFDPLLEQHGGENFGKNFS